MIAIGVLLLVAAAWAVPPVSQPTLTIYGAQDVVARKPLTLLDVFLRPVVVLVEAGEREKGVAKRAINPAPISLFGKAYNAYYLHYGLRTVKDYENFQYLYQYFVGSDALSGVVFFADQQQYVFNPFFMKNFVNSVELPDNLNIFEFINGLAYPVPVLVVTPSREFSSYDFRGFSDIGTFVFGGEPHGNQVGEKQPQFPFSSSPYVYPTLYVPVKPGDFEGGDDDDKPPAEVPDKLARV